MNATVTQPIKAVLFDLDDTLWPIGPVIVQAERTLQAWLAQHAPAVAQFSIECLRQRRDALIATNPRYRVDLWALRHAVLSAAFADSGQDSDGGSKIDAAMAVFAAARNQVTPFDDVLPNLLRWKARLALGSISNGFADLAAIGMAHHFQVSLAAHQFGSAKPDPAIFHAACAALGVAPAHTVYVGDDLLLDVEGAQKAGLRAVWINRKNRVIDPALHGHLQPDATCTTLNELDQWLNQAL
jgi:putative hydrolase of the HAD superfamily